MDEIRRSSVLREFARTLVTDFPIQDILEHLVEQIVGVLPVTSAGVTLIGEERQPRYVASSDASALRYERLQTRVGEGPCVGAFDSGEPVSVADLASEEQFPAIAGPGQAITDRLLVEADTVMYQAKRNGRGGTGLIDRHEPSDLDGTPCRQSRSALATMSPRSSANPSWPAPLGLSPTLSQEQA